MPTAETGLGREFGILRPLRVVVDRDDRTISRVDPAANRVVQTIRLAAAPRGIHFAHGRVWTTTRRCGSPVVRC